MHTTVRYATPVTKLHVTAFRRARIAEPSLSLRSLVYTAQTPVVPDGNSPVVQIDRFPERVVARIEASAVGVELVTKDQVPFRSVFNRLLCICRLGSVDINETKVA
jgi:hypothetical protein